MRPCGYGIACTYVSWLISEVVLFRLLSLARALSKTNAVVVPIKDCVEAAKEDL